MIFLGGIFWIKALYHTCLANIFSQSVACVFFLLNSLFHSNLFVEKTGLYFRVSHSMCFDNFILLLFDMNPCIYILIEIKLNRLYEIHIFKFCFIVQEWFISKVVPCNSTRRPICLVVSTITTIRSSLPRPSISEGVTK